MIRDSHLRQNTASEHTACRVRRGVNTEVRNRLTISEDAGGNQQAFHAQEHNDLVDVVRAGRINYDGIWPKAVHRCSEPKTRVSVVEHVFSRPAWYSNARQQKHVP